MGYALSMHSAASVTSVTSPIRIGAAFRVSLASSTVKTVQSVKVGANSRPSTRANLPTAPSARSTMSSSLPLGMLLTVTRPATSSTLAGTDYADLQNALRTGNIAVAQQAYIRLQNDLLLTQPAQAAAASSVTPIGGSLNEAA